MQQNFHDIKDKKNIMNLINEQLKLGLKFITIT